MQVYAVILLLLVSAVLFVDCENGVFVSEAASKMLLAKKQLGLKWGDLAVALPGFDETWIAAALYGQVSMNATIAQKLADTLHLGDDVQVVDSLTSYQFKGALESSVPKDPFLYRLYEILVVYGLPLKHVMQEKFGNGIMSAIDVKIHLDRIEDPEGERCRIKINGKWVPYRQW